ncbi:MAG TPA: DUF1015 domain-containing protein [Nitrolancea sp.]|nr:DUF1015 domain-containing protein [Nitrolancea sp.]
MANIRPFRGITFDTARVGGLSEVVGPPEDIPSHEQAAAIVEGHPYHAVRLEMSDPGPGECFHQAASDFRQWLCDGILEQSPEAAFYVHEHEFDFGDGRRRRRGIFAALELTEYAERIVLPHENTMPHNVEIRTELLRDVRANLSAVFTLVDDDGKLQAAINGVVSGQPDISGVDDVGGYHQIWAITNPSSIRNLREALARRPLYIADGHHRYTAALTYRDELDRQRFDTFQADWTLTYIADVHDDGVLVLPIHRVVKSLGGSRWDEMREDLAGYFDLTSIDLAEQDASEQVTRAVTELAAETDELVYLILEPGARRLLRAKMRDWNSVAGCIPADAGTTASHLDVTVLDCVILYKILEFDSRQVENQVEFTQDVQAAYDLVRSGKATFAAFVRPTPLSTLLTVARAGGRMPQKSTYFFPKIPIGLLMRDLLDDSEENA